MSAKYLNDSGLSYFWGKLKAWAASAFAPLVHVHASSDVTAMTGYSKPSSGSAIAASDTLNAAVGKLEAKVDVFDDSGYVHRTGAEDVGGQKTFTSDVFISKYYPILTMKHTTRERGSMPSYDLFEDIFNYVDKNDLYMYRFISRMFSNNASDISITAYPIANTSDNPASLIIGFDSNGIAYAAAPSTSNSRQYARDIVTRDWLPIDTRIVHTGTGTDESVNGIKTFLQSVYINRSDPFLRFRETDVEKGVGVDSGGASQQGLFFEDKNGVMLGGVLGAVPGGGTNKRYFVSLRARDFRTAASTSIAAAGCEFNASGVKMFRPEATGDMLLGTGDFKWKEIWCSQNSINSSSDERLKDSISDVSDDVLDAWASVRWRQFRYRDAVSEKGDAARVHGGAVAQEIGRAFSAAGLDASRYGFFLYDEWPAVEETRAGDGSVVHPASPAGDGYGLRYVEALCFEAAYMRRENARLKKRVSDLEDRIAALELRLGSE